MDLLHILLLLHFSSTLSLVGLIWFVQIVHYPLFHRVGAQGYELYEFSHQKRTTWVVAPLMCVEAGTAVAALVLTEGVLAQSLAIPGFVLIVIIWLSTGLIQVPCHRQLSAGYDSGVTKRLVVTNWLRTACWTFRAPLAGALLIASHS